MISAQESAWIKAYYLAHPYDAVTLPDWVAAAMSESGLVRRAGVTDRFWLSQKGHVALKAMLPVIGGHIIP